LLFVALSVTSVATAAELERAPVARPQPTRAEIAEMPFLERPTEFSAERWMLYGWRLRFYARTKGIFARDLADPSDRAEAYLRGRLRADTALLPTLDAYLDGHLNLRYRRNRDGDDDGVVDGELREAWLKWRPELQIPGAFLQAGRIRIREQRGFWWDEEIEVARIGVDSSLWSGFVGYGARLTQDEIDDDGRRNIQDDLSWLMIEVRHQWQFENFIELRALVQTDTGDRPQVGSFTSRSTSDEDLAWLGGRLTGKTPKKRGRARVHYWFEAVGLTGEETRISPAGGGIVLERRREDASGFAFDFGATLETALPGRFSISAAFATASRYFRQPSIFRNRIVLAGNTYFRRFGEVLRPSLSNMHVVSAAIGFALHRDVWLETVYHHYWQQDAAPYLTDDALVLEPSGTSRNLGHAFDVILGIDVWKKWEVQLAYGAFLAESAFDGKSGNLAQRATASIRKEWP